MTTRSGHPSPRAHDRIPHDPIDEAIGLNGERLIADASGALLWPVEGTVVVADLHLEKGSSFARRGSFLPPYDTTATLDRLDEIVRRHRPRRVICLGDSFHDREASQRLDPAAASRIVALTAGVDWVWLAGNHDPVPPQGLGGRSVVDELRIGPLVFRHEARLDDPDGEVSGHLHPKASIDARAGRISGRCFVNDGKRLVLPAFGAFTGGLSVRDPAIGRLFAHGYDIHLIGRTRVRRLPRPGFRAAG